MTIDYTRFPGLSGVYLEDSFVLAISELPHTLSFKLEAVLTPEHPSYHDPLPGEQYCYANAALVFDDVTEIEWIRRSTNRFVDASGEEDLGNIDRLVSDDGSYLVDGDWGEVRVRCGKMPRFELAD
ncbi:hypothetical protein [Rhodococcus sp. PvR044]|uniref:hypothetical protein n=1 Tax=Rhodococcus sp. PvR044 TaxID=3156402 RepID=UPI003397CD26